MRFKRLFAARIRAAEVRGCALAALEKRLRFARDCCVGETAAICARLLRWRNDCDLRALAALIRRGYACGNVKRLRIFCLLR